jgi:subtilisin family serine protease
MRKSKFSWLSVLVSGLGIVALLGLPAIAQPKTKVWQVPRDWKMYAPDMDYAPGSFVLAFKNGNPKNLQEILATIKAVGVKNKLEIVDASDKYFGRSKDKEPTLPKAVMQTASQTAKTTNAVARAGTSIAEPNVCGNLVKYFEFGDLSGDALADLIKQLNTEVVDKFDDVYLLEPDTTGYPKQTNLYSPDWAKPAIGTTATPVKTGGVTVAVLDSGYTPMPGYTPDRSWNAVFRKGLGVGAVFNPTFGSTNLADIIDDYYTNGARGHGTGVASIIRGPKEINFVTNPPTGPQANTISLTSDANIYPIKVCDTDTCSSVSIVLGICKAISDPEYPVGVINLSLAGPQNGLVEGAVLDAIAANVTVVASAANLKTRKTAPAGANVIDPANWNETPGHYVFNYPFYPAAMSKGGANSKNADGIISVSAAQRAIGGFEWAVFSPKVPRWNIDPDQPRTVTNLHTSVDLMAPGREVLALPNTPKDFPLGYDIAPLNNVVSGTSYAAPYVSAAAAILLGRNPTLTPKQLETVLLDAARLHPVDCPPNVCGAGMVNVQGGLDLLNSATYLSANGITP